MPRIAYESKNFRPDTLAVIDRANAICREYQAQGFDLTLRQLYYQFVSRGLLANTDREYKRLGSIVNDGRMAGLIDWDYITDRTRNLEALSHWDDPSELVDAAARQYREELWADQPEYVEVWIEKDALVGVIENVCTRNDVAFFSCRGYTSQSEMWGAGQRLLAKIRDGKSVTIIHLGDHDPSGIDMSRDIEDRLRTFTLSHLLGDAGLDSGNTRECTEALGHDAAVHVERIALTMDQVEEYGPPPNPAKITDSRAGEYIAFHGPESWELDALDPGVLDTLIDDSINEHIDEELWGEAVAHEQERKRTLDEVSRRWDEVLTFLGTHDDGSE